jgi:hypothetical protein
MKIYLVDKKSTSFLVFEIIKIDPKMKIIFFAFFIQKKTREKVFEFISRFT